MLAQIPGRRKVQLSLLVWLMVALVGGALLGLLLVVRRRREERSWAPGLLPSSRSPRSRRFNLRSFAIVSSGDITGFGIALGVALILSAGLAALFWLPQRLVPSSTIFAHADRLTLVNDVRATLLQAVAGLGAIVAAIRTWLAINERGQITERLNRAVEQLANPNLEVRVAAIFALGQIAVKSERDREAITQILAGYVRTKSPWPPSLPGQFREEAAIGNIPALEVRTADVQVVMNLLVRRPLAGDTRRPLQLTNVDLRCANLINANLQMTVLKRAHLQGANLAGAQLQRADLAGAQLQQADLTDAKLQSANLSEAQLQNANLSSAHLQGTILVQANLQEANLSGAELQKTNLDQANLRGVNFTGAKLKEAIHLNQANLRGANLDGAQLPKAALGGAQLQQANLGSAQLQGATLEGAQLQDATLLLANLQKAKLGGAQLQGAYLVQANLQGADLGGAQLQGAYLVQANLQEASLVDADLSNADLSNAQLQNANLAGALADTTTRWPEGFNRSCGASTHLPRADPTPP
jgi:uncharacterized protein YjbI with pentapeptide repeats